MNTTTATKTGTTVTAFVDGIAVADRNSKKDTPWASLYWTGTEYGLSLHGTETQARKAVAQALSNGWWNNGTAVEVTR
jgi:hypothetical protein